MKQLLLTLLCVITIAKCDLQKWFLAIFLTLGTKNNLSSRFLGKQIGVTKDTALSMINRIRKEYFENSELLEKLNQEIYIHGSKS